MSQTLAHDATASTEGTIYALFIAVQKCFEMVSRQKVIIERYGDVTVSASQQLEIKKYEEPLTDNHENFWKTLRNWMQDRFDETVYAALVLCTTQAIGKQSLLRDWNSKDLNERIQILRTIHQDAEGREKEAQQKKNGKGLNIPKSLRLQREVMNPSRTAKLRNVIAKFVIADLSPSADELYGTLKDLYAKGILVGKRDDFLNALLGFVICPTVTGKNWEISCEDFSAKVAELTTQYCRGTAQFPTKYSAGSVSSTEAAAKKNELFVTKILDIEYRKVVPKAIEDYVYASETTLKELKDYEVPFSKYQSFARDVLDQFEPKYRRASRTITDLIKQSQDFYDEMMSMPSPTFPGFENPPLSFRNGVIHMHTNDSSKTIKWRLGSS